MTKMEKINGYEIYKCEAWCEIIKDETTIYWGSVEKYMTHQDIYESIVEPKLWDTTKTC